jgi:type IV pilus assembly protein PilV
MKKHRRSGLSLLEVMVAMCILSVGLLGMLSMQIQAMASTRTGRHVSDAARVGLDRLETLKYQSWAATAPTGWTAPLAVTDSDPVAAAGGQVAQVFNVSWRIQDVAGLTGVRQLDVRVTWREPGDPPGMPPRRYAVSSLKCSGCGGT